MMYPHFRFVKKSPIKIPSDNYEEVHVERAFSTFFSKNKKNTVSKLQKQFFTGLGSRVSLLLTQQD